MVVSMYCLKDEVINDFGGILLFQNDGAAMRALKNSVNVDGSIYKTAPNDYTLYELGTFDSSNCDFVHNVSPRRVCSVNDLIER